MSKNIIKVPIYNYSDNDIDMSCKRAYSDVIFNINCPNCDKKIVYQPNTYTLLYVPESNPHVHFYCEHCEHEDLSFFLDDIKDGYALLYKNPDFKGKITLSNFIEIETDVN